MAWVEHLPAGKVPLSTVEGVTLLLIAVFVDPWGVAGGRCPYGACTSAPTGAHAMMCVKQNTFGCHAVHDAVKFELQALLRSNGVPHVYSEVDHCFPNGGGRMDTVTPQGSLTSASKAVWREGRGAMLDSSIAAPTRKEFVKRAVATGGFAAGEREQEKLERYPGFFDKRAYALVPMVQETFGRLGRLGREFLGQLASHKAARSGGSVDSMRRQRGELTRAFAASLNFALARASAARVLAYVRMCGRQLVPVSTTLMLSA
jgi:hypothetical protein